MANNLAYQYNRLLIFGFALAPFVGYITFNFLDIHVGRIFQLFSFLGLILLFMFKKRNEPFRVPLYLVFYLLFILYVFYSAFVQLDRQFKINYIFSNPLIGAFNFMFIIENISFPKKYYNNIFRLSKYVLVIAFVVILYQQLVNPKFFLNTEFISDELIEDDSTSRLGSIYSWAGFLTNGFGFVPVFMLVIEHLVKNKKKYVLWLLIGLTYAVLTKARWIMLNTLIVFIILVINRRDKIKQILKYSLLVPVFLLLSYFALNAVGVNAEKIVNERILEKDKSSDHKSATTRLLAFKVFNKIFWDNPVFGVGSIKYGMGATGSQDYKLRSLLGDRSSQLHVGYLSLFYMYGLIGGGFFIGFLILFMKKLYIDAKRTKSWAPFIAMLGFVLANFTLVAFSVLEMGFVIVLVANKYHSQKKLKPNFAI